MYFISCGGYSLHWYVSVCVYLEGGGSSLKEVVISSINYVWKKSSSQVQEKPGRQALGRRKMKLLIYLGHQGGQLFRYRLPIQWQASC